MINEPVNILVAYIWGRLQSSYLCMVCSNIYDVNFVILSEIYDFCIAFAM